MSAIELVTNILKLGKKSIENAERIISLEEVSQHFDSKDCWIVLYDKVYDITKFLQTHPGGESLLLEESGRDCTSAFIGHSDDAVLMLSKYEIGILPPEQRIYRHPAKIMRITQSMPK